MRVRTSRTILLWLAVVFLGGIALLALAGDAEARRQLPAQLAVWTTIGGLVLAGWWFRVRPRRDLHRDESRSLGLRSEPGDARGFLDRPYALLGARATAKDVENTSWGTWRGLDVTVFDYWLARSSDLSRDDYEYYTCSATPVPPHWPDLSIVPVRGPLRLPDALAADRVEFELEAFNRAFEVRTRDRRFAHALVDARLIRWLLELPRGTGFEIAGGTLLCRTPRSSVRDLTWALETMATFLGRVPPVVASLYGPAG